MYPRKILCGKEALCSKERALAVLKKKRSSWRAPKSHPTYHGCQPGTLLEVVPCSAHLGIYSQEASSPAKQADMVSLKTMKFILLVVAYIAGAAAASLFLERHSGLRPTPNLHSYSLLPRALPIGTCNAQTPCENAACCGTNGLCGYSPTECGAGNCTSNCDAKAECGQYAKEGKQKCPLNVCCSQFGWVLDPIGSPKKVIISNISN